MLDGEVVAFEGNLTSFARLQGRIGIGDPARARASGITIVYYVFDLLHLDGRDLTRLPLRRRKSLLRRALRWDDPLRFTPHRNEAGRGLPRRGLPPGLGGRHRQARRRPLPARPLHRLAQVQVRPGTGAGDRRLHRAEGLAPRLRRAPRRSPRRGPARVRGEGRDGLRRRHPPAPRGPAAGPRAGELPVRPGRPAPRARWVRPDLVCEVAFTEWTRDGRLRHPRYLGLRNDKDAAAVVRERPGKLPS